MCENECCCEKPERLEGDPSECSPEQIEDCHGNAAEHPCVPPDSDAPRD